MAFLVFLAGCAAPAVPKDVLIITSAAADAAGYFDVHCCAWKDGQPFILNTTRAGPSAEPPRPLALTQRGEIVAELRSASGSRSLCWLGNGKQHNAPSGGPGRALSGGPIGFEEVLDAGGGQLVLAYPMSQSRAPVMRVEQGIIQQVNPPWVSLAVWDIDNGTTRQAIEPWLVPVVRCGPSEWLVLVWPGVAGRSEIGSTNGENGPTLRLLDWTTGRLALVAPWESERRFAGAVLSPDGQWVVIAAQRVGQRWNLFDLIVWDRATNKTYLLLEGCFTATDPRAQIGPTLPMEALNGRHLAFVVTTVSDWRDSLPLAGTHSTAIIDVKKRAVLCRLRHPQAGLGDEVPPPYLPADQLDALRIERWPPAAVAVSPMAETAHGGDERWRRFLRFRDGRLASASGQTYTPADLGLYAYSGDGLALAVRYRAGGEATDECLVFIGQTTAPPLKIARIERLTWLPMR